MKKGKNTKTSEKEQKPKGLKERLFELRGAFIQTATVCRQKSMAVMTEGQKQGWMLDGKAQAFEESGKALSDILASPSDAKTEPKKAGT